MVDVTVYATLFIVILSASVTCMTLPDKFVNRVMQDVIAEILEDEPQNPDRSSDREASMKCVRENFESIKILIKSCSTQCEAVSEDMLSCMMKVAKMDTPLDYTERQYLGHAITIAAGVLGKRWKR